MRERRGNKHSPVDRLHAIARPEPRRNWWHIAYVKLGHDMVGMPRAGHIYGRRRSSVQNPKSASANEVRQVIHRTTSEIPARPIDVDMLSQDGNALLASFKQTAAFKSIFSEALAYAQTMPEDETREQYLQKVTGYIFSVLAEAYLRQRVASMILSPEQTLQLFHDVWYPHLPIAHHPFNQTSIQGVNVPDGLIVEGEKIVAGVEYTMSSAKELIFNAESLVKLALSSQRRHAFAFSKHRLPLFVVVPFGYDLTQRNKQLERDGFVIFVKIPVSRQQLHTLVDSLMATRSLESAQTIDAVLRERGK